MIVIIIIITMIIMVITIIIMSNNNNNNNNVVMVLDKCQDIIMKVKLANSCVKNLYFGQNSVDAKLWGL